MLKKLTADAPTKTIKKTKDKKEKGKQKKNKIKDTFLKNI